MSDSRNLVIMCTRGIDDERSSVAWTIANGAITEGLQVSMFLTSAAVDVVRKGGCDMTKVDPLDPLKDLVEKFMSRGGKVWACTPCVKARGYAPESLIEGVEIAGASGMLKLIKEGAGTLSF